MGTREGDKEALSAGVILPSQAVGNMIDQHGNEVADTYIPIRYTLEATYTTSK